MRRREFITLLGGAAAWPLAARGQHAERIRRIGLLLNTTADNPYFQTWVGAFLQGLQQSGWSIGQNVRIDTHWAAGSAAEVRKHAAELAALAPDVILAHGDTTVGPLLQATRTVPIVFPVAADPVGAGFVDSLAREVAGAAHADRAKRDAGGSPSGPFARLRSRPVCRHRDGGTITQGGRQSGQHARRRGNRARHCGLLAPFEWRFDPADQYRHAAGYVDRILKGEKPDDMPVQVPTKYELVINLKTAKALGLTVSPSLIARANEVIE